MAGDMSEPAKPIFCPSCGLVQAGSGVACARCGRPLSPPGLIYRREADGNWTIIRDIDLSKLVSKPSPAREKLISRPGAVLMLAVAVAGTLIDIWGWETWRANTRQESETIARYLDQPVGRIIPEFKLAYQTSEGGRLEIAGETNLPDGTVLEVEVYAGETLVAVDFPVTVANGRFKTRPLVERGKPFSPATYHLRIRARFEKSWQPPKVLLVVGRLGERLEGGAIHRGDATPGARLDYEEDFVLSL
jgi:hypothetical protein